jgi:hypothetical protein
MNEKILKIDKNFVEFNNEIKTLNQIFDEYICKTTKLFKENALLNTTVEFFSFYLNQEHKNIVLSILNKLDYFTKTEQNFLKTWIQKCLTANDFKNLEILHNEIVLFKNKNTTTKTNNLNITEVWKKKNILYEFQISKNFTTNDFYAFGSPYKMLQENILFICQIVINHFKDHKNVGVFINCNSLRDIKKYNLKIIYISFPFNKSRVSYKEHDYELNTTIDTKPFS